MLSIKSSRMAACIFVLTNLLSAPVIALDLTLHLEQGSDLTKLTDTDWQLLKTTAKEALNTSQEGKNYFWQNPKSFNSGVITILSTDESSGGVTCRNASFTNTTKELTSTTIVKLCQQGEKWVELSSKKTTFSKNTSTRNDLATSPQEEVTNQKLDHTSERCRNLSRNIDELKGKPLRRSAAMDLYSAECLR